MEFRSLLAKINTLTRAQDWRLSFVPLIMAYVYLWISIHQVAFSWYHLLVFILSITTTVGFAALGYFINEFFDKKQDLAAHKINKLALLPPATTIGLFLVILLLTFGPWLLLPRDNTSYILIAVELALFLLYSLPGIRLKSSAIFSGIVDAMYAYLIPGFLSYHTFHLIALEAETEVYIPWFFVFLFIIGYRNIFIHQLKDILPDIRSKTNSLPQRLGINKSNAFLKTIVILELVLLLTSAIELALHQNLHLAWVLGILIYLFYYRTQIKLIIQSKNIISSLQLTNFLNQLYQVWLPLYALLILTISDWRWICIVPIHLLLFIKRKYLSDTYFKANQLIWHQSLKPLASILINYPIYIMFRLIGVNLKKENKSALQYIKDRFK